MEKQPNSADCFICGVKNIAGVHVRFYNTVNDLGEPEVLACFTGQPAHQGYPGRMHGGVISGILDETMGRAINAVDAHTHEHEQRVRRSNVDPDSAAVYAETEWGVTAELTVRFQQPVPLGVELTARGRITRDRRRLFEGSGELYLPDGTVAITASGRYFKLALGAISEDPGDLGWRVYEDDEL